MKERSSQWECFANSVLRLILDESYFYYSTHRKLKVHLKSTGFECHQDVRYNRCRGSDRNQKIPVKVEFSNPLSFSFITNVGLRKSWMKISAERKEANCSKRKSEVYFHLATARTNFYSTKTFRMSTDRARTRVTRTFGVSTKKQLPGFWHIITLTFTGRANKVVKVTPITNDTGWNSRFDGLSFCGTLSLEQKIWFRSITRKFGQFLHFLRHTWGLRANCLLSNKAAYFLLEWKTAHGIVPESSKARNDWDSKVWHFSGIIIWLGRVSLNNASGWFLQRYEKRRQPEVDSESNRSES